MDDTPRPAGAERVLVVEDDAAAREGLAELIAGWGFAVETAADGEAALARVDAFSPTIVVSDLVMPRMDGLALLRALTGAQADVRVVLLTAQGSIDTAVEALKCGAEDYLTKPVDPRRLQHLLTRLAELHAARRANTALRRQLDAETGLGRLVGASAAMREVYALITQAAPTTASVLVTGESGTGKELVARLLHERSPRAPGPYVAINCAAIPESLLESEVFGHERGAFTGAVDRRAGVFELADTGTLLLDEIAEMAPAVQAKLLRVLQERRVRRVGGQTEQAVDVRVVAATNANPLEAVRTGRLREDLYYRLNVFTIALPPLRAREGDVPRLAAAFAAEFTGRDAGPDPLVDRDAMRLLEAYDWPGNVRELRNVIERAVILARGGPIGPSHLPPLRAARGTAPAEATGARLVPGMTVDEAEQQLIRLTLEAAGGNKTRAAGMLGISLKTLHNKLHRMAAGT